MPQPVTRIVRKEWRPESQFMKNQWLDTVGEVLLAENRRNEMTINDARFNGMSTSRLTTQQREALQQQETETQAKLEKLRATGATSGAEFEGLVSLKRHIGYVLDNDAMTFQPEPEPEPETTGTLVIAGKEVPSEPLSEEVCGWHGSESDACEAD
jgi:hypothetical protein